MKGINMKKIKVGVLLTISIMLLPLNILLAQHSPGPFNYQPPQGVNRWTDSSSSEYAYKTVSMNLLTTPATSDNGLVVSFDMKLSLSEELKPLVAFSGDGQAGDNVIEIVYSKRTVTITRYKTLNGKRVSYDYHLFDALFEDIGTNTSARWHFTVFFTSTSLYLVCTIIGNEVRNMMSPIFLGLDDTNRYPDSNAVMYRFLKRDSRAVIKLGDPQSRFPTYISNIKINSFNNAEWSKTMQKEFATPQ